MTVTSRQSATVTLPADDQIRIEREFDAPRELVFKALTTPELVKRWWHANRGEVTSAEINLRVGGKWRYVSRTDDGMEFAFSGECMEIVPNERIVQTELFENLPPGVPAEPSVNTMTLTETDGRTRMVVLVQHASKEQRDGHIGSGMEAGMQDALDLLEDVATSLR